MISRRMLLGAPIVVVCTPQAARPALAAKLARMPSFTHHQAGFIVTDKSYVAEKYIRWIRREADGFHICVKERGCEMGADSMDTHKVTLDKSPETFKLLESAAVYEEPEGKGTRSRLLSKLW